MTIALIAVFFAADLILFFYFKNEIRKLKLLLGKQPKVEERGDKIPMDEQWSNFLSYDGRGK